MDQVERAQRQYRRIAPQPVLDWPDVPIEKMKVWVEDDVCPVVEAYRHRPAFMDHAIWPLRALARGAGTAERDLIDAVDAGLVRSARSLLALAGQQAVHRRLRALNPATPQITAEAVVVGGAGARRVDVHWEAVDRLPLEIAQVEQIAGRFWSDLACGHDYFAPMGGWMERPEGEEGGGATEPAGSRATPGEFVLDLNPALHPVGDFVSRCLLRRVEILFGLLETFRRKCLHAVQSVGLVAAGRVDVVDAERQCWQALSDGVQALNQACFSGPEARRRDACVILTQTYAAFGRAPDLVWLGLPADVVAFGATVLRHRFTNQRNGDMMDRIAAALGDLRDLYEGGPPQQSAIDEAIARGGLVVIEASKEAFWELQRIDQSWREHPACWKLLRQLAAVARVQGAVKEGDLYPDSGARSKLPTTVSRLKKLLPPSLGSRIRPVHGERRYRLELESHRVDLFNVR